MYRRIHLIGNLEMLLCMHVMPQPQAAPQGLVGFGAAGTLPHFRLVLVEG